MAQVLENGRAFSAADIVLTVAGVDLASASSLTIKKTVEKVNNTGFSKEPTSRGRGVAEYECSIEIAYKDIQKLKNIAPAGDLTALPPFNVIAVMNNGQNIARITAKNAEFTDDGIDVSEGDTEVKTEYNLIIAGVDYL